MIVGVDSKYKKFLRAIPEGDTKGVAKSTVVIVNNILNVYRGNPNYYCSVSCGTSVTSVKEDLLEGNPLCAIWISLRVTGGCNF